MQIPIQPMSTTADADLNLRISVDDLESVAPAAPSETKELPVEMLNTGDIEIPEPPSSGGQEPTCIETPVIDLTSSAEMAETGQPIASNIAGDVEAVEASAGTEALTQPPVNDRNESDSANSSSSDAEVETDSDPCLDESDDDSDDDSDEDGMITREDLDRLIADPKKKGGVLLSVDDDEAPRTKNEIDPASVEIPDRRTMLLSANAKLYAVGMISSFVEGVMVIKANEGSPTVDLGSALALGDRNPLGWIDDIIGPVDCPFYLVRLRDDHGIPLEQIAPGTLVFAIEELCQYLKMSALDTKGTDASHQHDEENPDIVYYSDDEEERNAKKKTKPPRRAAGPPQPRTRRPPPGHNSGRPRSEIRPPYPGARIPSGQPGELPSGPYSEIPPYYEGSGIRPPYQGAGYRYDQYLQAPLEPRLEYGSETWQNPFPNQRYPY